MNTKLLRKIASVAALSATVLAAAPLLRAADHESHSAEKHGQALPLAASFGKGKAGEHGGPYAVTLKNTGKKDLKLSAKIVQSVAAHNTAKTIDVPAHELKAGDSWTINDLAVEDRVVVTADGYDKLEVVVPPAAKH